MVHRWTLPSRMSSCYRNGVGVNGVGVNGVGVNGVGVKGGSF
jgi:hypothetical protein